MASQLTCVLVLPHATIPGASTAAVDRRLLLEEIAVGNSASLTKMSAVSVIKGVPLALICSTAVTKAFMPALDAWAARSGARKSEKGGMREKGVVQPTRSVVLSVKMLIDSVSKLLQGTAGHHIPWCAAPRPPDLVLHAHRLVTTFKLHVVECGTPASDTLACPPQPTTMLTVRYK